MLITSGFMQVRREVEAISNISLFSFCPGWKFFIQQKFLPSAGK
jgi:hypothetical protein